MNVDITTVVDSLRMLYKHCLLCSCLLFVHKSACGVINSLIMSVFVTSETMVPRYEADVGRLPENGMSLTAPGTHLQFRPKYYLKKFKPFCSLK